MLYALNASPLAIGPINQYVFSTPRGAYACSHFSAINPFPTTYAYSHAPD